MYLLKVPIMFSQTHSRDIRHRIGHICRDRNGHASRVTVRWGEPSSASRPYGTTTTLKNRIAAFSSAVAPSTAFQSPSNISMDAMRKSFVAIKRYARTCRLSIKSIRPTKETPFHF